MSAACGGRVRERLEDDILSTVTPAHGIRFRARQIENSPEADLHFLVDYLSNDHHFISFTVEMGGTSSAFLYLLIPLEDHFNVFVPNLQKKYLLGCINS